MSVVFPRLDSEMPEGVEMINSTLLFLRPLKRNDSGVYRCEVANDINLRSRDVRILIQGELSLHTRTQLTPIAFPSLRKHCVHARHGSITACDIVLQLKCDSESVLPIWFTLTVCHSTLRPCS